MSDGNGRSALESKIVLKAMSDGTFMAALKANPETVVAKEMGITWPAGYTVKLHQETAADKTFHLVLPMPASDELPDEVMDLVSGGDVNLF